MAKINPEQDNTEVLTPEEQIKKLQATVENLSKMVEATGDQNKITQHKRRTSKKENYKFSMALYPDKDGDKVITSWRTVRDYVANGGRIEDQRVELTLEDGKKVEIQLVDFSRTLKPTPKIQADKIFDEEGNQLSTVTDDFGNLKLVTPTSNEYAGSYEGKDLYIKESIPFIAVIPYNGKTYEMNITFLNAI